ncbi:unnamed protein product [Allacma fusca]|uniref:Uncharacterized protein n=1 Tax=Allacma fusca TaxID=39272 RepID=A0A8J2LKG3_9HEXA|nr:unnamed protein product [Allacma fusca]
MLQATRFLRIFLLLSLASLAPATDVFCDNVGSGDCTDTVVMPAMDDEDARGVFQGQLGYGTLLSYFTTMVPSQGTGRNKPLKFRFRFPYVEEQEPNRPPFVQPTWEIKDRMGFAEPPIWGKREPQRGKKEPNRGRQVPLRRGPPILETRSSDEIEDFNERKYQAYAEYYGLPYKANRDGTSGKKRNGNKNNKKKGTSNYSVQKKRGPCEDDLSHRGCVKYYDSHGNAHLYENHPFAEEEVTTTTSAPVVKKKKKKSSVKSRPKSTVSKRTGQNKLPQVVDPPINRNPPIVSSYSINRKNSNNRNPSGNKRKKNNRRKGQKKGSQVVGTPENHDDSLEGVDRETLQELYNRNHQPPRRYTYKVKGSSHGNRRVPYGTYSSAPAEY